MRIAVAYASVSIEGDYYQVLFDEHEDRNEQDGDYLLIQRQFEMPDNGKCYIETHNTGYIGHFKLKRVEFRVNSITLQFDRKANNTIEVIFSKQIVDMPSIRATLEIIQGKREPYVE